MMLLKSRHFSDYRKGFRVAARALMVMAIASSFACEAPGVGDPCSPERIPPEGFVNGEVTLETSSVQCRTRVCMVYQLDGIPTFEGPDGPSCDATVQKCASAADTEQRVYCTCRCDAPASANAALCECPENFTCQEVIAIGEAGIGVQGSYCVRSSTI